MVSFLFQAPQRICRKLCASPSQGMESIWFLPDRNPCTAVCIFIFWSQFSLASFPEPCAVPHVGTIGCDWWWLWFKCRWWRYKCFVQIKGSGLADLSVSVGDGKTVKSHCAWWKAIKKLHGFVDVSLKGKGSIGRHKWSLNMWTLLLDYFLIFSAAHECLVKWQHSFKWSKQFFIIII